MNDPLRDLHDRTNKLLADSFRLQDAIDALIINHLMRVANWQDKRDQLHAELKRLDKLNHDLDLTEHF